MKKTWIFFVLIYISFSSPYAHTSDYTTLSTEMHEDFLQFKKDLQQKYTDYTTEHKLAYDAYKKDIEKKWALYKGSTVTDWVQYSEDLSARSSVNFKDGFAEFEALLYENTEKAKQEALDHLQKQITLIDEKCQKDAGFMIVKDLADFQDKAVVRLEPNMIDSDYKTTIPKPVTPLSPSAPLSPELLEGIKLPEASDFLSLVPPQKSPELKIIPDVNMTPQDMSPQNVHPTPLTSPAPQVPADQSSTKKTVPQASKPKDQVPPPSALNNKAPYTIAVRVPLPSDYLEKAAAKYRNLVYSNSKRFKIQTNIVYAIIHTESYFNPFARSHIPAFGLMQLVPKSGGKDAYEYVYKKSVVPSENFLYDPKNNILLGTAYFRKVKDVYFKGIHDEKSAYIVSIAAYNTGIGNVAYALTGTKSLKNAVEKINTMTPSQVCATLLDKLPYEETKKYLEHILNRSAMYRGI